MRKSLVSLLTNSVKYGVPLTAVTTSAIYVKNKVKRARAPRTLKDVESEDKKIVVVGGGLSGLTTAYYLATQSEHNKVLLLEKERKCGQGSSSRNGGIFLTNSFEPLTEKSLLQLLPGFFKITGP